MSKKNINYGPTKPPEKPKGKKWLSKAAVLSALLLVLQSCGQKLNEIIMNPKTNSTEFRIKHSGDELKNYHVIVEKRWDTYYWLVTGDLKKEYHDKNVDVVFHWITEDVWNAAEDARLSSLNKVYELERKTKNKIKFVQWEYKKMVEEWDTLGEKKVIIYNE